MDVYDENWRQWDAMPPGQAFAVCGAPYVKMVRDPFGSSAGSSCACQVTTGQGVAITQLIDFDRPIAEQLEPIELEIR